MTTVSLPEELHVRAKVAVAQRSGMTLRQLIIEGIELRLTQLDRKGKRDAA